MGQTSLEQRVASLERSNRLLASSLIAVVAVGFVAGFQGQKPEIADVLKARALVLYSADNKTLVQAGYDSWTQGGRVAIYDQNGERKSWWRASPVGAHLFLSSGVKEDEQGTPNDDASVILSVNQTGANMSIFGKGTQGWMGARGEQDPEIALFGKDDKPVFTTRKKP